MTGLSNANEYTTPTTIVLQVDSDVLTSPPSAQKKPTNNGRPLAGYTTPTNESRRVVGRVVDCARRLIFQKSSSNVNSTLSVPSVSENSESDFFVPVTKLSEELMFDEPSAEDLEGRAILSNLSSRPPSLEWDRFRAIEPMLTGTPSKLVKPSPIVLNKSPLPKKRKFSEIK